MNPAAKPDPTACRTEPAACIVLDCRRTGKPRQTNGEFICAKHLGTCPSKDLTIHANAAHDLKAETTRYETRGGDRAPMLRAGMREANAWGTLRSFVAKTHGLKTETPIIGSLKSGGDA